MNFDDEDVRRVLNARSAPPSPEFRDRLSGALAQGRRAPDRMPALAAFAAIVLAVALVGALLFVRASSNPRVAPATTPSPAATASPTPSPAPLPPAVAGVLTPPPGPIALPAEATLSAPSSNVVWALVDQYLYRSTDQGRTWQQRPLAPAASVLEISFVSDSEGWLETQCDAPGVAIWHTSDAGATWTSLGAHGIAAAQCNGGLSFVDSTHGFIGAWDQNDRPVIYFTTDGGLNWSASPHISDPPGFTTQPGATSLTARRVRAFGGLLLVPIGGYDAQGPVQYVYGSNDGGATWRYKATVPGGDGTLALVTATRWLQLIGPGQSTETTDGGKTWHASSSQYSQAAPIAPEVTFADAVVGYATVRGEIQLTVDGGQHWTSIKTPGT